MGAKNMQTESEKRCRTRRVEWITGSPVFGRERGDMNYCGGEVYASPQSERHLVIPRHE